MARIQCMRLWGGTVPPGWPRVNVVDADWLESWHPFLLRPDPGSHPYMYRARHSALHSSREAVSELRAPLLTMSSPSVVFLAVAALAVLAQGAHSSPAPETSSAEANNPLRTIGREECRPGLCPHIRQLVPDLSQAPPHIHQQLSRSEFVGEPSLCGNLCINDQICPSHQKCCPTTCGYACQDTVHIHEEY